MLYECRQFDAATITLGDRFLIGMGNRRRVFVHPDHPNLCIKIARTSHIRSQLDKRSYLHSLMPTHWRDDNWLEARAYQQPLLAVLTPEVQRHIPTLYGWQNTNLGKGLVFDFYTDKTGLPAKNLSDLILENGVTAEIRRAVNELKEFILNQSPWMRHPGPPNIVYGADNHLKLVDCLGTYNMRWQKHIPAIRRRRRRRHNNYLEIEIAALQKQHAHASGKLAIFEEVAL